jgi:hypothetical protein
MSRALLVEISDVVGQTGLDIAFWTFFKQT